MPQVVLPALIGAAAGATGTFTGVTILGSYALGGAVVYGGLALVSSLTAPKPPDFGSLSSNTKRVIRTSVEDARWVVGRARVGGVLAYYLEPDDRSVHLVIVLSEGPVDGVYKVWIDGQELSWEQQDATSRTSAGGYRMTEGKKHVATSGSKYENAIEITPYYDGGTVQDLIDAEDSQWTSAHRLEGKCFVHVKMTQPNYGNNTDARVYNSFPALEFLVSGQKITWPGQTTPRWTSNAAAIRYWWLTERRGVPKSAIDEKEFKEAFDYCGATIRNDLPPVYTNDGYPETDFRYQINGVIRSSDPHDRVEAEMDFAWAGSVVEISGRHIFRPGRDRPVADHGVITEADIIQRQSIQPAPALSDRVNAVSMSIAQSIEHDWSEVPLLEFVDSEGQDRDGRKLAKDLGTRPYVCCPVAGGRLMAILTRRARAQKTYSIRIAPGENLERLNIIPSDIVTLSDPTLGIDAVRCMVMQRAVNPDWSIDLVLEQSLDGTYADSTVLPPLHGKSLNFRGNLAPPDAPKNVRVAPVTSVTDDGTARSFITASWSAVPHRTSINVQGPAEQTVVKIDQTVEATGTREDIQVLHPGTYTVTIVHISNRGVRSAAVTRTAVISWAGLDLGGQRWIRGEGDPTNDLGRDGFFYLDSTNGELWEKLSGVWQRVTRLTAADGTRWITGASLPAPLIGKIGDFYLRTTNGYVYEKTAIRTWTYRSDLTGPAGPTGPPGRDGKDGRNAADPDTWYSAIRLQRGGRTNADFALPAGGGNRSGKPYFWDIDFLEDNPSGEGKRATVRTRYAQNFVTNSGGITTVFAKWGGT